MVFPSLDVFRNAGVGETRFPRLPESDKDALRSAGLRYTGSDTYGQIRAELARKGTPVGPYDQMIAGHARSRGLVVVTNNLREFERIPGIRIEDWC